MHVFQRFYRDYPKLNTVQDKMIAIDVLIHAFHMDMKKNLPKKSAGFNLIEGNFRQTVDFLDSLSSTQKTDKNDWRETEKLSRDYRRGKLHT